MDDMHFASVGCRAPWAADCGPGLYGVGSAVPAVAAASWYASAAAAPATASTCEGRDWPSKAFEAALNRAGRESELFALHLGLVGCRWTQHCALGVPQCQGINASPRQQLEKHEGSTGVLCIHTSELELILNYDLDLSWRLIAQITTNLP